MKLFISLKVFIHIHTYIHPYIYTYWLTLTHNSLIYTQHSYTHTLIILHTNTSCPHTQYPNALILSYTHALVELQPWKTDPKHDEEFKTYYAKGSAIDKQHSDNPIDIDQLKKEVCHHE